MASQIKWTKNDNGLGSIQYTEETGRFMILKAHYATTMPYALYDNDKHVRSFSRVATAKRWADEMTQGKSPTAVKG